MNRHTSVLQFLEQFTGVREPNISDWRRSTFGDLTSALRIRRPDNKVPSLPDARGPLIQARYEVAHLPSRCFLTAINPRRSKSRVPASGCRPTPRQPAPANMLITINRPRSVVTIKSCQVGIASANVLAEGDG